METPERNLLQKVLDPLGMLVMAGGLLAAFIALTHDNDPNDMTAEMLSVLSLGVTAFFAGLLLKGFANPSSKRELTAPATGLLASLLFLGFALSIAGQDGWQSPF